MQICKHEGSCLSSAIRGARNGVFYGAKIRSMHALVMTFLFKKGTLKEKLITIIKLTYEHAKNLGTFVFFYKLFVCLQTKIRQQTSKIHSLVSGAIIGYLVFRKKTQVNQQMIYYLLSRVIVGSLQNLQNKDQIPQIEVHPIFTAFVWGMVMFLFEDDPNCLQSSLADSMKFLYKDSDKKIESWKDLVPLNIDWFKSFVIN